tara:strand:- start:80 stop:538 length:459 start_codon:yes stop_codon:yes gene_type:complete
MFFFNKKNYNYFVLVLIIIILDQISKYIISTKYDYFHDINFIIFSIKYVRNYGAAFNIFSEKMFFLSTVSILSSIILIYFIFFKKTINLLTKYGLSFILAGSIGNGIDRVLKGYVIDFINLKLFEFPIFNIADIAINIGCIILIFDYFKNKK